MLNQFRQRKIVQYSLGYVAAGAALFGGLATVGQVFDWPDAILRALFYLLLSGFFVTLVLAWYHGEKGRQGVTATELSLLVPIVGLGLAGAAGAMRRGTTDSALESAADRSVAVLPFVNMSGNAENEYFSDGITEEILNALATLTDLKVPARTSSFAFKGQNVQIRDIAQKLGVEAVVEGSVRRSGDQVRITAQLIDANTGDHMWSEQYDRALSDVFAVQTEIALRIANELNVRLENKGERRGTRDPNALDFYLRGLAALNAIDYVKARDQLNRATARDSTFALAYAALSDALSQLDQVAAAKAAATTAVRLDSRSPEAHTALGYTLAFNDWQWDPAEREFDRALELQPSNVRALSMRAYMYAVLGKRAEAAAAIDRAHALDPLSLRTTVDRALIYRDVGRYQESLQEAQRALQLDPRNGQLQRLEADLLWRLNQRPESLEKYAALGDSLTIAWRTGDSTAMRRLTAVREQNAAPRSWLTRASYHARISNVDRAFVLLDSAALARYRLLPFIVNNETLASLHADPRWDALLKRMGIPQRE